MRLLRAFALSAALPVAAVWGCGANENLADGQADAGSPSPDASGDAATPADAGPVIRTVQRRNPFGNTDLAQNLLVDGDFELTSASGQFGWQAYGNGGNVELLRETGGLCQSGVVCGVMPPDVALLGLAAAPRDEAIDISAWGKPPPGKDCYSVSVSVVGCSSGSISTFGMRTLAPVSDEPGADGWCHYSAFSPPMTQQPCIYATAKVDAGEQALLDNVSLIATKSAGKRQLMTTVPTREFQERLLKDLNWMLTHKRFGRPQPTRP